MTDRGDAALERIATALEQMALDGAGKPLSLAELGFLTGEPPLPTPPPEYADTVAPPSNATVALPPVQPVPFQFTGPTAFCPVHRVAWKTVPAGTSKKTGKPYGAFLVCRVQGCEERPRA